MSTQDLQRCIDACLQCLQDCERALGACLAQPQFAEAIRILQDCADICQLCIYLMLRNSNFHAKACQICAEVCLQCAETCSGIELEACRKTVLSSRHCAELCQQMSA